jgi:hypothetical protein
MALPTIFTANRIRSIPRSAGAQTLLVPRARYGWTRRETSPASCNPPATELSGTGWHSVSLVGIRCRVSHARSGTQQHSLAPVSKVATAPLTAVTPVRIRYALPALLRRRCRHTVRLPMVQKRPHATRLQPSCNRTQRHSLAAADTQEHPLELQSLRAWAATRSVLVPDTVDGHLFESRRHLLNSSRRVALEDRLADCAALEAVAILTPRRPGIPLDIRERDGDDFVGQKGPLGVDT